MPVTSRTACAIAIAVARVISGAFFGGSFGRRRTLIRIACPAGADHVRPSRPLPAVWHSHRHRLPLGAPCTAICFTSVLEDVMVCS